LLRSCEKIKATDEHRWTRIEDKDLIGVNLGFIGDWTGSSLTTPKRSGCDDTKKAGPRGPAGEESAIETNNLMNFGKSVGRCA
jgi:hypothetical protein